MGNTVLRRGVASRAFRLVVVLPGACLAALTLASGTGAGTLGPAAQVGPAVAAVIQPGPPANPSVRSVASQSNSSGSTPVPSQGPTTTGPVGAPVAGIVAGPGGGYYLFSGDGQVFNFGAGYFGSMGGKPLNAPIVGMAATRPGGGYWLVASDGGIFSFGDAAFHGSMGGRSLTQPIVGMAADPATGGYWEVASDGGIFAFDAPFFGSMGGRPLNQPVVGMAATPTGGGYWLVASDGGIFSFGDAAFYGSMGGQPLTQPIVGLASDPATGGYWEIAADGGLFSFGVPFYGSLGATPTAVPVVGMAVTATGGGYWTVTSEGGVHGFGGAADLGDVAGRQHPYLVQPTATTATATTTTATPTATSTTTATTTTPAPAAAPASALANPSANIPPNPDYQAQSATGGCWAQQGGGYTPDPTSPACISAEVAALDAARAAEGLGPMQLPGNFSALTPAEQLFVVTDIERVSRGLAPVAGLTQTLDAIAQSAASSGTDPEYSWQIPGSNWWGGTWAGGVFNALDADYTWMYQDGWGGPGATFNIACTAPTAPGCWAHRDIILSTQGPLVMGAGYAPEGSLSSLTEVFVAVQGSLPPLVYTWADAVAAGAAG